MRVKHLEPISLSYPEPNDDNNRRYITLCRVEADDGTVGWGEAITQWPEACRATEAIIEGLAPLVVGRDPVDTSGIWTDLKRHMWWYGYEGGIASYALSAIDIALWDLKGKALGRSVASLLGWAGNKRLPVIASTHAFLPSLEEEVERHARYVADGYKGVKIGFGKRGRARLGYELERDVRFMRQLREACGASAWIMIDRAQSLAWDVGYAIKLVNALDEYDLRWIEEPFEPADVDSFRKLRMHVRTMIAGGEREWQLAGFRRVIDAGAIDVIGCDPGRAEGITGALKVIQMVEAAGNLWFNAHAWSGAIITAASLALSVSTSRCLVFELKPLENPMQHELVERPFTHQGGWIEPPDEPGLGVTVREDIVRRYRL